MTEELPTLPSEVALAKLREKVIADGALSNATKDAFLADLEAQDPATLTNLKAVIVGEG